MNKNDIDYTNFIKILEEELLPAMGCTEPIAVAYCAAMARKTLGAAPDRVVVEASGNIIKNVKSVIVPNTGHLRGIPAAAAAGIVAGNADKQLEVIASVTKEEQESIRVFMEQVPIAVNIASSPLIFDIVVTVYAGESYAKVRIANYHTNIVLVEKDGEVLQSSEVKDDSESDMTDRSCLSVEKIYDFANTVDVEDVKKLLDVQIAYNMDISEEGLKNDYGANIGSVLLKANKEVMDSCNESALRLKARAMAAAGSDARMGGCSMPVVINSGSGNQGMTVSLPVIVFADEWEVSHEKLCRSLVVSNLIAIHQKYYIGSLSAYCGAVSAACGAGAGITYMYGGTYQQVSLTIINTLGNIGGIVCDGAKPSCAAKIATSVDAALMAFQLSIQNKSFLPGEGIIKDDIEETIKSMGYIGRVGMRTTDTEILNVMIDRADINEEC